MPEPKDIDTNEWTGAKTTPIYMLLKRPISDLDAMKTKGMV